MKSWKRIGNQKGTTMVEVLVGFTLLMMMTASFLAVIRQAVYMYMDTKDVMVQQEHFAQELSKKHSAKLTVQPEPYTFELELEDGTHTLELDGAMAERVTEPDLDMAMYRFRYR